MAQVAGLLLLAGTAANNAPLKQTSMSPFPLSPMNLIRLTAVSIVLSSYSFLPADEFPVFQGREVSCPPNISVDNSLVVRGLAIGSTKRPAGVVLQSTYSGREIARFDVDDDEVGAVDISPDNKCLVAITRSRKIDTDGKSSSHFVFWNTSNPKPEFIHLIDRDTYVYSLRFSPDSKFAYLFDGEQAAPYDVREKKFLTKFRCLVGTASRPDLSSDGKLIVAPREKIEVLNSKTGERAFSLPVDDKTADVIIECRFSPDSRLLGVGTIHGVVSVWSVKDQTRLNVDFPESASGFFTFSPDSKSVAILEGDAVEVIDLEKGESITKVHLDFNGSLGTLLRYSNDGKQLLIDGFFEKTHVVDFPKK